MIGIGVIGYGYWGPNIARNIADYPEARLVAICESDPERRAAASRRYPSVPVPNTLDTFLAAPDLEAVCVATPVATHKSLAMAAMAAGKHVLVEKPLAATYAEAMELVAEAKRRGLCLMVDHTYVYTGAVRRVRDLVRDGEIGSLLYYDSTRINLGLFQHDVNVIWDLAVHDLSILDFVTNTMPVSVSATGMTYGPTDLASVAYLTLGYDMGMIAHVNVNWLSPTKMRRTVLGGDRKMIVMDDLDPSEKIRLYDKGVTFTDDSDSIHHMLVGYRVGDMWAPQVDDREALSRAIDQFVAFIVDGTPPDSDGALGARVVAIAEAADASLAKGGTPVVPATA
jgi:predicted dehydrogenase